jgi:hypothetical protein
LEDSNIVLSPHWREIDPRKARDTAAISLNYKHGVFNGGFVGVNRKATDFLDWWFASCLAVPRFHNRPFIHDDQKFLDVVPVYFENVHILKHKGCNVSEWNEAFLERSVSNDRVIINGNDELVFAHFANSYSLAEREARECVMLPLFRQYESELNKIREALKDLGLISSIEINKMVKNKKTSLLGSGLKSQVYLLAKKVVDRAEK